MSGKSDFQFCAEANAPDTTSTDDGIASQDISLLYLESLAERPIVPQGECPYLLHRSMVCLDNQGHCKGVIFKVTFNNFSKNYKLLWQEELTDRIRNSITDLPDAVEKSALAFTFLIITDCTGMTVIRQAKRKSGFDYFLIKENNDERLIFKQESTARLEVSGILDGDNSKINSRFKEKFDRAAKYKQFNTMPIYVCVVEHSAPKAEVRVRHA